MISERESRHVLRTHTQTMNTFTKSNKRASIVTTCARTSIFDTRYSIHVPPLTSSRSVPFSLSAFHPLFFSVFHPYSPRPCIVSFFLHRLRSYLLFFVLNSPAERRANTRVHVIPRQPIIIFVVSSSSRHEKGKTCTNIMNNAYLFCILWLIA